MKDDEGLVQSGRWEKPFGGFSRKGLTDFSLTTDKILQMGNWRIKKK
jgi:hypothetical protein